MNELMKRQQPDTQSKGYQKMADDPQGMALNNMLQQVQQPQDDMMMGMDDPNNPMRRKFDQKQSGLLQQGSVNPPLVL